ncbi:MAG: HAD-IB family phosphatase [Chloroflexi bacterium]|nr:HAD-IB family phosphatase [Chloroflexota bacterium]
MLIVIDFDETASSVNGAQTLLRELGVDRIRGEIRARFDSGETSFKQYQEEEFDSLTASVSEIKNLASKVIPMRDGLGDLMEAAREGRHQVVVASAGLDLYIEPALCAAGIADVPVISVSATCDEDSDRIVEYVYPPSESRCEEAWAVCKCYPMRGALETSDEVVFIGDGRMSDTCAARTADTVFARSRLLEYCESEGIEATAFEGLEKVAEYVRSRTADKTTTGMGN